MFCSNCGTQLPNGANFCSKCGQRQTSQIQPNTQGNDIVQNNASQISNQANQGYVQPSQPVYTQPQQNVQGVKPLMVLNAGKKEGMMKFTQSFLIFYYDHMIVAHLSQTQQNQEMKTAQQQMKAEGVGFLKQSLYLMGYWFNYGDKYYDIPENLILSENPHNYVVPYNTVSKFKFECVQRSHDDTNDGPGSIVLVSSSGKTKFTHQYKDYNKNIKNNLTNFFGNKLSYRGRGGMGFSIEVPVHIGGKKRKFE